VNRLARALAGAGVAAGDRVLWLGQNSWRVLELLLASAKIGAFFCPANWRSSVDEMAFVIDDLGPRVVVWQEEETGSSIAGARQSAGARAALWLQHDGPGAGEYEEFLAGGPDTDPAVDIDPSETLLLIYTAAWSGRPSAAMLSHTALVVQGLVMASLTGVDAESVYLNSGPLFHLGTLMNTFATFVAGGTNVFVRRVDAEEMCRTIEAERCTGAYIVGPTIEQVLDCNRHGRYDLSSLRWPVGRAAWDAMVSPDTSLWGRWPGGYGQTETVGMLTFNTFGLGGRGAHGRPSPLVRLRIVDPDDGEVPAGEVGEITARGPTVMNGYWNRPEENARRQRGGWHHTNDLGRREADGTITFIGPKTRMIKSAAENIYPTEVEQAIGMHPAVAACAVIGVPDPLWVQSVTAIVVLRDGAAATEDDIVEHCRGLIASYKKPRSVKFVVDLPRRGLAVDYDALDARFGGGGYPGGTNRSA
jgi:long-chain acyl-CoA synthetase